MTPSPKIIGKYEILEELGRGGFAVVYKARHVVLDRIDALKVLRPALGDDPDFVARFEQEAWAAARLKHPHIVTVYDAAQIDGQLIIAMQYVEGRTLRDELAQGPLPLDRALAILEQIAGALDYAHQRGIVHRDVKPANILLEEAPPGVHATLLDFGLAKAMEASTALTSQGTLLGSPEYMAPEQADPNRANEIGPATDRYALGIVAYQLLTGRVPFPGNTPATLNAHLNLKPTDPHSLRSEVSPRVSVVLLKMLAKAPADRYASAGEFVATLRKATEPRAVHPIPAKPSRWLRGVLIGAIVVIVTGVVGYAVATQLIQPTAQLPAATQSVLPPTTPEAAPVPPSTLTAGSRLTRTTDGMTMVYVPAGTFKMGSETGHDDERPAHDVTLDAFWIDHTEVTNAQYAKCVSAGNCDPPSETASATRDSYYGSNVYNAYPVIYINWNDADKYCKWAGGQLPTEAQWEYAARGPQNNLYPWGIDQPNNTLLNYTNKIGDTTIAGSYPAGASWVDALDLAGNVWEWVNDWYGSYPYSAQTNPTGPTSGDRRVLRGSYWGSRASGVRATYRNNGTPDSRSDSFGFRCAMAQAPIAVSTPAPIPVVPSTVTPTPEPTLGVGSTRIRTTDGMTMVYVPGGTFKMGSDPFETPIHSVTLDAFWIDQTEVTNAAFQKFVADTGYRTDAEQQGVGWVLDLGTKESRVTQGATWRQPFGAGSNLDGRETHPVVQVSWNDANAYCQWAGGSLPTEAEWEYAARGSQAYLYPWGNDQPNENLLNYDSNRGDAVAVGSYPQGASWVESLDMAGNVAEWVGDRFGPYADSWQVNPTGPASGNNRVLRGGSWSRNADLTRSAYRSQYTPDSHDDNIGFRCVMREAPRATSTPSAEARSAQIPVATSAPTLGVGSTHTRTTDGMTMVYVPGGTFKMGSAIGEDDEKPIHDVTLDAFWIDRTEVTNAQYAKCVSGGKCTAPSEIKSYTHDFYYGNIEYDDYPVIYVSWNDADNYCKWAGGQLPTEAQWEYAARDPNSYIYPWGNGLDGTRLNFCDTNCPYDWADKRVDDGYADTAPVGSYPSGVSWVGAVNLAGNVWEWVQDWYAVYPDSSQTNPIGPATGIRRVLRGGSWGYDQSRARVTYRGWDSPDNRDGHRGFRCALKSL